MSPDEQAERLLMRARLARSFEEWRLLMELVDEARREGLDRWLAARALRDARRADLAVDGEPAAWSVTASPPATSTSATE